MNTFMLEIVTPERKVFAQEVNSISVKGVEGELGILAGHIPMVTPLQIAPMKIKVDGKEHFVAVHGGFLEVRKDKVVLLAESAELPENIDVDRAKASKSRAEQRISMADRSKQDHVDFRRAELSLQRAIARLKVSENR